MITLKGTVSHLKVLKLSNSPLVYFQLDNQHCLIAKHSLNFLADVENGMQVIVGGQFNSRNQFVAAKYAVLGKTRIMIDMENFQQSHSIS
ncbi:hypothetical protein [Enterococcus pallens]|uniref:Single-stranded DNA-binding protein n=1 Tax=Enterococcus pallens ATCC BAA-351 TaxID=1158607 RepID=R2QD61_9ENTE|nr:hypothetical protein [Enterococcus pallens]EOH93168.1 hypothetical protein UAU_02811 [Enterococcus pallens ATCC BAA-351]EOU24954.1 hypothetical protein I588_00942 [Enterococcus pallens ATCC BAA-351]OJG76687.1 hypothetical protein RV10_GL003287 [Enterococcus pallens]